MEVRFWTVYRREALGSRLSTLGSEHNVAAADYNSARR
jgi:hypothetical protein